MTPADFTRWISWVDELDTNEVPRCITLISHGSVEDAVTAFRAGPETPRPDEDEDTEVDFEDWSDEEDQGWNDEEGPVEFHQLPSGTVVLEDNGYTGSAGKILAAASQGRRAASMYWSINADCTLLLAENGRILCSVEPLSIELP
ncbi:hypothetical protein D1871_08680 [Nakamurella silvestris]|nr:hypothetical protein D1871_08680 [Nakamurella silvestris]